ncbi:ABC transporter permease [Nonomuraea sp. NPDC046570]|uniref:ABC transporter permease n=1 Tax=Nonomuraea sp. NPDC046570 TaxID=3155255 RepID=UPI0033FEAB15
MTGEVLRSEWTKMRSVRSTMWTLISAAVLMLVIGGLLSFAVSNSAEESAEFSVDQALNISLGGLQFAALAIATLGVLVISGEYRTGMIRTSLLGVPQRLRLLAAKVAVFTVVSLVVTTAAAFAAFFLGQAFLGTKNLDAAIGDPGVMRAVFGAALFLTASGLFGLALGALIRHTPGALVAVIALNLVLPQMAQMLQMLPGEWGPTVARYFTSNAGTLVARVMPAEGALGPWTGFGVYLVWIAVPMVAAAILLRRRDA